MFKDSQIYIAGHNGMVGSAIHRLLVDQGFENLVTRSSNQLDLRNENDVREFFADKRIEYVFVAAAKVGGIKANSTLMADFAYDNIAITNNILRTSSSFGVKKLLYLGSSCIYPKEASNPIPEEALLSGKLEQTNEGYALAKILGVRMCDYYRKQYGNNFISLMPCNLYGVNDSYDLENSHVVPALIRKIHQAKIEGLESVEVWGTGNPRREFLYVDDLAKACIHMMQKYSDYGHLNIGSGSDISIKDLAHQILRCVNYNGSLHFNSKYPDGVTKKLMLSKKANSLGWYPEISMEEGLRLAYGDYLSRYG